PRDDPFDENPVRLFREVGTTVFKSGWEPDDFVFVFRSGPFINHQHIDQGTFWLSDRGSLFIEERHGSTYYEDPLYQPWYTQPVGHSTLLIDHNHQSQRVGDLLWNVEGFDDYAFTTHFLDGENAAFTSGDIGRLYWGKVKCLKRNILYLKPRTLLMLDTITPGDQDVDVTALYQTHYLESITASNDCSEITVDGNTLFVKHLAPDYREVKEVETPHYLYTLQRQRPLKKEGMLTVTARTNKVPLVLANLLTSTTESKPVIETEKGNGFASGKVNGIPFVFTTFPGNIYDADGIKTDALVFTGSGSKLFVAICTTLIRDNVMIIESEQPVTCEIDGGKLKYYSCTDNEAALGVASKPTSVMINGKDAESYIYDGNRSVVKLTLPSGEGIVEVK
ncbi:MAG: heparinase II/III family protein, partial [Candidatus Latescibacteria bacterium]|nr:heparinase II/III family protein [Candidatus Latescibacterota bacterium]